MSSFIPGTYLEVVGCPRPREDRVVLWSWLLVCFPDEFFSSFPFLLHFCPFFMLPHPFFPLISHSFGKHTLRTCLWPASSWEVDKGQVKSLSLSDSLSLAFCGHWFWFPVCLSCSHLRTRLSSFIMHSLLLTKVKQVPLMKS